MFGVILIKKICHVTPCDTQGVCCFMISNTYNISLSGDNIDIHVIKYKHLTCFPSLSHISIYNMKSIFVFFVTVLFTNYCVYCKYNCKKISACSCKFSNGEIIDLNNLANNDKTPRKEIISTYFS